MRLSGQCRPRVWRPVTPVLALALACMLPLAACSGDSDEPAAAATASSTTSASPSEPPSSADKPEKKKPSAPTLPAAAKGDSVKAAKAFVEHYIDLFNYAMTTGETKEFRAASRKCEGCDRYAKLFEKQYKRGGFNLTQGWSIQNISMAKTRENLFALVNIQAPRLGYQESKATKLTTYPPDDYSLRFIVAHSKRTWAVSTMESSKI